MSEAKGSINREVSIACGKFAATNLLAGAAYLTVLLGVGQFYDWSALAKYDLSKNCDPKMIKDAVGTSRRRYAIKILAEYGIKNIEVRTSSDTSYEPAKRAVEDVLKSLSPVKDKPNIKVYPPSDQKEMEEAVQVLDYTTCIVGFKFD